MQPGTHIANYEIVRLIGRGGMSEVYEAIQTGTGRRIAMKLLGPRAEDPRYVERLQLEGYALARIRHPNVVIVYDAGSADGQAWIAMDLLEGYSMRDLLWQKGRLPLPQVLAYVAAIFDGLEAAHRLDIIHRDMKPENVFLTIDGGLKIVDFGNAKFLNSGLISTDPHRVFGTAAYMSPEQLGVSQAVGPRSDLYAVGLMMYEMLLGRHAFSRGPDPYDLPPSIELCRMQIEDEPPSLVELEPRIPEFLSAFVARLTAKDSDRRPASAFLCAREVRDMHDAIVREAHSRGIVPAGVSLRGAESPLPRLDSRRSFPVSVLSPDPRASLRPVAASRAPDAPRSRRRLVHSMPLAIGAGLVGGVALFGVLTVARNGSVHRFALATTAPKESAPAPAAPASPGLPFSTDRILRPVEESAQTTRPGEPAIAGSSTAEAAAPLRPKGTVRRAVRPPMPSASAPDRGSLPLPATSAPAPNESASKVRAKTATDPYAPVF